MSNSETDLEPDEVVAAAAGLAVTSDEVRQAVAGAAARIRAAHDAEPWGHDGPGNAFRRSYLGSGEGTEGSGVDGVLEGADAVCGNTYDVATQTGMGAIESQLRDEESEARITQLASELRAQGVTQSMLADQGTVEKINELDAIMQDPRVAEYLGDGQAAEIEGFLGDVERLAE